MDRKLALVVDDDELVRLLLVKVLEHLNLEVACARSGQEALEMLGELARVDLIVLDLLLPNGTGWDVLDFLEQYKEVEHIPVVIMSGVMLSPEEHKLLKSRVAAILNKAAFDLDEVNTLFRKLLAVHPV